MVAAIVAPPHEHVWGPCISKWFGAVRKRECQVPGCNVTTPC